MTAESGHGWLAYALAASMAFAYVAIVYLDPHPVLADGVYLSPALRSADPGLLATDWSVGDGAGVNLPTPLFNALVTPLWWTFDDATLVSLVARILVWIPLIASLAALCSAARLHPLALPLGLALFAPDTPGQSMAAQEALFGGAEQKVVGYTFVFAAIAALLHRRVAAAGALSGIAIAFHVLVGGWSALALSAALVLARPAFSLRETTRFVLSCAVVSAPMLAVAFAYLLGGEAPAGAAGGYQRLLVEFRLPFHLDPAHFLTPSVAAYTGLCTAGAFTAVTCATDGATRRLLLGFLAGLATIFCIGLLARAAGAYELLVLYPFRVADVMIPCIGYLAGTSALVDWARRRPRPPLAPMYAVGIGLLLRLVTVAGDALPTQLTEFRDGWADYRAGRASAVADVSQWIAHNTDRSATFVAHPCLDFFWIEARRAMVACWRSAEHNATVVEWVRRAEDLNGGRRFASKGREICDELTTSLASLTPAQLNGLRDRYRARYYLVDRPRPELTLDAVYENGSYWLYDLAPGSSFARFRTIERS